MTLLVSILASLLICGMVITLLACSRTPHYRVTKSQVEQLMQSVLLGQAMENDWRVFCEIPIRHDEYLETVRIHCVEIDERCFIGSNQSGHFLNEAGLQSIEVLLQELRLYNGPS